MSDQPPLLDALFDQVVERMLFTGLPSASSPTLHFVLSSSASGRSRVTGAVADGAAVLNARDLELLARAAGVGDRGASAAWLQRGLGVARERRVSLVLEGGFRTPALAIGLARSFAERGYRSRVSVVAERASEVRMSDASRRFDAELRHAVGAPVPASSTADVAALLPDLVGSGVIDQVTVFDRAGGLVFDEERAVAGFAGAVSALEAATAARLGTLRSTLWLSELRRMTRMLGESRSAPRWAVDELIALHEVALEEIVPELPISLGSDTATVQSQRLRISLDALHESVTSGLPDSVTMAPAHTPQQDVDGPAR